jgi:uncharacterized protein
MLVIPKDTVPKDPTSTIQPSQSMAEPVPQPQGTVRFHLAFPVNNMAETKAFYTALGCTCGRENPRALILNFYDHQLVAHLVNEPLQPQRGIYPRHFGLVFSQQQDWQTLLQRAEQLKLTFFETPKLRFPGSPLEHHTFFLEDPAFNLLEFKHYRDQAAIFGQQDFAQIGDPSAPS